MGLRLLGLEFGRGPGNIVVERLAVYPGGHRVAVAHRSHRGEAHHRYLGRGKRLPYACAHGYGMRAACVLSVLCTRRVNVVCECGMCMCMCMWHVACGMWRVACCMCMWRVHVHVACAYLVAELLHGDSS